MIIIARFNYRHEAEYAYGFLQNAGVPAVLSFDDAGGAQMGMTFSNPARIMVLEEDAEAAREVLRDVGLLEEEPEGTEWT